MDQPIRVFKFGGASLKDTDAIKNVADILASYTNERLAVVVSAIGGTTDKLEKVAAAHARQDGTAPELLEDIKRHHFSLTQELFGDQHEVFTALNDTFVEIDWALEEPPHDNYDYVYDQIVSVGELLASTIVAAYLNHRGMPTQWLDARDLILTDNIYREGWVQWTETNANIQRLAAPALAKPGFVLTQGFIGSTSENFTTTLGREGSDYTAAILAHCLNAADLTIWKDVPGVLTADPRLFENVTKLERLSYREAIEMTYYGANVIHPKTIKPLQNKSIPLYVKSFVDPSGTGTLISEGLEEAYPPMVAIEGNQALLQISTRDFSFVAEHHIRHLFNLIAELRIQVNMMQNSAISFSLCINDIDDRADRFAQRIEADFKVVIEQGLELITVRHPLDNVLSNLKRGKIVLLEGRIKEKTVQMVVKDVPVIRRKTEAQ